ncbi:MAG: hypothetical protein DMF74_01595 [Acidobacteria bacterium]|nr:MAG: hypothetical protein DMF74_01595 [Acidobacteriota bacterium]
MSQSLEFGDGSSTGNDSVFGAPSHWVRSKNGIGVKATYNRGRAQRDVEDSFFSVVWQIKIERDQAKNPKWARTINLQVESPRHPAAPKAKGKGNSFLNDLKRQVVKALLTSEIGSLLQERGYRYDDSNGRIISGDEEKMKGRITITPLKVLLNESQVASKPEETIKAVHEAVGSSVEAVLQKFTEDLNNCFVAKVEGHPKPVKVIRRQTKPEGLSVRDNTLEYSSKKTRYEAMVTMTPQELFEQCCSEIKSAYDQLGHKFGWRFLTCQSSAFVTHPKVALITLQPGGRRDYFPELPRESQERGSAYLIESWDGVPAGTAPLQQQVRGFFGALAQRIGAPSGDKLLTESLSSHFIPFRAPKIALLPNKRASLDFSESLWSSSDRPICIRSFLAYFARESTTVAEYY